MPKPSWREKYKGGDKKKTARAKNKSSKEAFKKWFEGKLKNKGLKGNVKGEDHRKDDKARFKRAYGGSGFGGGAPKPLRPSLEGGKEAGIGKDLMDRLQATKMRLLVGNAEAARAGVVKAEPGAWAAAASAANLDDSTREESWNTKKPSHDESWEAKPASQGNSDHAKGKGKGKGKGDKSSKQEKGKDKSKGKGKGDKASPQVQMRTQEEKEEIFWLNKKIADHARTKDLEGARGVLAGLEEKGWANSHTYAAAVNAFCRCGDWKSAESALGRAEASGMLKRGQATSSVVARTSMLRGYCDVARNLAKARDLLKKMEQLPKVAMRPNVRTANTFLRGCLVLGAVSDAEALLKRMEDVWCADKYWEKEHGGAPDASSYESVVALLCQSLRHLDAMKLAEKCISKLGHNPGSGSMFVAVARAAAVCGDWDAAAKAAGRAHELLDGEAINTTSSSSDVKGSGGKRGTQKDDVDSDARTKSLEIFQTHRRAELLSELKEVEKFVKKSRTPDLSCLYSRALIFEDRTFQLNTNGDGTCPLTADFLCRRLCDSFGLKADGRLAKDAKRTFESALQILPASSNDATPPPSKRRRKRKQAGSSRLDLRALFSTTEHANRPVHLELCSGGGEWTLAQAARDRECCWVACELRFDRAVRCFQRIALRRLSSPSSNVGLIVGDAKEALELKLLPRSCARLFINHPEPPHQTDLESAAASEATHLLTAEFLQHACSAILSKGGIMTICTDSPEYGKWLRSTLAASPLNQVFEDALDANAEASEPMSKKPGKLRLRSEPPPVEICGAEYYGDAGASYFQRLKKSERGSRGQNEENRYFLCLRKR